VTIPRAKGRVPKAAGFARIFEEEAACGPRAVKAKPVWAPGGVSPVFLPRIKTVVRADRVIPLNPAVGLDRRTSAHWRGPSRLHAQPDFKEKPNEFQFL
jgi:hypothetical protein